MGQECTITAYQHIRIGEQCVIADKAMFIDFDHGVVEVERPIRTQGIYKRDVEVGSNVWIGYGACVLRGVRVGDNSIDRHQLGGDQGRARERRGRRHPGADPADARGARAAALGAPGRTGPGGGDDAAAAGGAAEPSTPHRARRAREPSSAPDPAARSVRAHLGAPRPARATGDLAIGLAARAKRCSVAARSPTERRAARVGERAVEAPGALLHLLGHLDQDPAAVGRVGDPSHVALLDQPVDHRGHRAAGEPAVDRPARPAVIRAEALDDVEAAGVGPVDAHPPRRGVVHLVGRELVGSHRGEQLTDEFCLRSSRLCRDRLCYLDFQDT